MDTKALLDRFEILFSTDSRFSDLRRFYIDNDINSLYRILGGFTDSPLIEAVKLINNPDFVPDCLSRGQVKSKLWLIEELAKLEKKQNLKLGTVFLCGGWYAILAAMMFEQNFNIDKVRSFDIDDSCRSIAETFNKKWVMQDWKFKSCTQDIHDINYSNHVYHVFRSDGSQCELTDSPDTVINTSCEHIVDFDKWYSKIPNEKLIILQTNNYFEIPEHINCSKSLEDFALQTPLTTVLYEGEMFLEKYSRFMRIGIK